MDIVIFRFGASTEVEMLLRILFDAIGRVLIATIILSLFPRNPDLIEDFSET